MSESKCREEFEKHCGKFNIRPNGDYAEDIYQCWQAAWDARGKVDAEIALDRFSESDVAIAIEQENEK